MSIIAEALKKAQRKGGKGADSAPQSGKAQDQAKSPVAGVARPVGAQQGQIPRAKPISSSNANEAVKSMVGARPAAAPKPAAVKSAPQAAPDKQQKKAAPKAEAKKSFFKQRKVRWAILAVSAVAVFGALMAYVNLVYLPGVSSGGITSAPLPPVTSPPAPDPQQAVPSQAVENQQQAPDGEQAAVASQEQASATADGDNQIAIPPVPDLGAQGKAVQDEAPLAEQPVEQVEIPDLPAQESQAAILSSPADPAAPAPRSGWNPPSIVNKGEQSEQLREDIYHFNMAVYFQRKGDAREALREYREVIRLSPHNAEVYSNMGVLYNQIGEFEQAVAVLQKALLIDPRYSKARNNLAVAHYRNGQYGLALEQANLAVEIEPGNMDALNNIGLIYRKLDRPDMAEQSFSRALAVDPGYPAAHYNLALLYEQTGQLADAARHYRTFLAGGGGSEQLNAKVLARLKELTPGS